MLWPSCCLQVNSSAGRSSFFLGADSAFTDGVKATATNNYISIGLNLGLIAISLPTAGMIFWRFGTPAQPRLNPVLEAMQQDGPVSEPEKSVEE